MSENSASKQQTESAPECRRPQRSNHKSCCETDPSRKYERWRPMGAEQCVENARTSIRAHAPTTVKVALGFLEVAVDLLWSSRRSRLRFTQRRKIRADLHDHHVAPAILFGGPARLAKKASTSCCRYAERSQAAKANLTGGSPTSDITPPPIPFFLSLFRCCELTNDSFSRRECDSPASDQISPRG